MTTANQSANARLINAKAAKDDEFYTPYDVVSSELDRYYTQLQGKTIFCPCDDPRWSSFVKYFINNRDKLQATVYASCYYTSPSGTVTQVTVVAGKKNNPCGVLCREDYRRPRSEFEAEIKATMKANGVEVGRETQITILEKVEQVSKGQQGYFSEVNFNETTNKGDFEKTATFDLLLHASDVVVTNPPFSKFRDFIDILVDSGKKFLVLGSNMACNYKNVFEYVKAGKLWAGYMADKSLSFNRPNGSTKTVPVTWYTNLEKTPSAPFIPKNGYTVDDLKKLGLWKVYDERKDVLYIKAVADIPLDYTGLMAVPVNAFYRFLDGSWEFEKWDSYILGGGFVDGVKVMGRIVIRRKQNAETAQQAEELRRVIKTAPIIAQDDNRGYIYLISDESGRVKIGITKNMIEERVNQLQTGNAEKLTVLFLSNPVYHYEEIEAKAHEKFSSAHIRGEWFDGKILTQALAYLVEETAPSKQDVSRFRNI